jgi:DNA-binding response OmpR family regulator
MAETEETLDILFVASDEGLAEIYKLKLELDGYQVRVVGRPPAPSIDRPLPSLIFLDIGTLDQETTAFFRDLRANPLTRDLPVVVLTEYSDDELRKLGMKLGARDFLVRVPGSRTRPSWSYQLDELSATRAASL